MRGRLQENKGLYRYGKSEHLAVKTKKSSKQNPACWLCSPLAKSVPDWNIQKTGTRDAHVGLASAPFRELMDAAVGPHLAPCGVRGRPSASWDAGKLEKAGVDQGVSRGSSSFPLTRNCLFAIPLPLMSIDDLS